MDILISQKLEEYDKLISILAGCAARPGMYGRSPDSAELLARHLTHICFSIVFENWEFDKTQSVWKHYAKKISGSETFADVFCESHSQREMKWGTNEATAKDTILRVYLDLLEKFGRDDESSNYTKRWVRELESSPDLLGSPDAADGTLFVLVISTTGDKQAEDEFREKYNRQCRQLNEDGRPNLQDFKAIAIGDIPTYQDYTRLAAGLKLIYSVLLKLRKRLTG